MCNVIVSLTVIIHQGGEVMFHFLNVFHHYQIMAAVAIFVYNLLFLYQFDAEINP